MIDDRVEFEELRRALVVVLRHHGDVLLTSPVLTALQAAAPQLEIDALVYAETREMLSLHPALAQIHLIDRKWSQAGSLARLRSEIALLRGLAARRYDLLVHLTENPRGAFLARVLRPRYAVARRISDRGVFWHRSFTHLYSLPRGTPRHTVERNLDALRRLGLQPPPEQRRLALVPGRPAEEAIEALLRQAGAMPGRYVHLHPASRWMFKCWPAAANARLIERLEAGGWRVVVTAAPSDREMQFVRAILAECRAAPIDLAGRLSLKELAALGARSALFVGVDSAPMHIAAALGAPCVAIFGPSAEKEWGPWMVPHRIVASTAHPCRPCGIDGCGGGKVSDCLVTLGVEPVTTACFELLAEAAGPGASP